MTLEEEARTAGLNMMDAALKKPARTNCCVAEVESRIGLSYHQCTRKRGHGPDGLILQAAREEKRVAGTSIIEDR